MESAENTSIEVKPGPPENPADLSDRAAQVGEAKRALLAIFLALLPVLLCIPLTIFWSSVPGRTIDDRAYGLMPVFFFVLIMSTIAGLVYWKEYLSEYIWLLWLGMLGFLPLLICLRFSLDAWNRLDDSTPVVRRVKVVNQTGHSYQTKYGKGTSYTLEIESWRAGEKTMEIGLDRYDVELTKGREICIEERPGRLGHAWITDPHPCPP